MSWSCTCSLKDNQIESVIVDTAFEKRFAGDKVHFNNGCRHAIIDGVILNKGELLKSKSINYQQYVETFGFSTEFPNQLRGPFTGLFFDGFSLYAYGNQTGDTCVFYYFDNDSFVVSPDFNEVVQICRKKGKALTFNEVYANHILSFGFAVEGHTAICEIRKTMPGYGILLKDNECRPLQYHKFVSQTKHISLNESVEQLDIEFRKAINRCFEKDKEYGYRCHLADMSGGLDSRMTSWVAHELGYRPVTNVSYSKSESKEEQYSHSVADALGNEFIFRSLDDVHFIYDIESIIRMNYGLAMYAGITGGKDLLETIDFNTYGLEHTGQIGDVVIGSFATSTKDNNKLNIKSMLYGDRVRPIIDNPDKHKTKEMFGLYYRAFQGALSTHQIRRHFTEAVSPFLDVDFIQFCLNLPLEYRCGHRLYFEWVEKKYPKALEIPCTRHKPSSHKISKKEIYHLLPTPLRHLVIWTCQKLHLVSVITDKNSMNPFDYWYEHNQEMRDFINNCYQDHIQYLSEYPTTYNQMKKIFDQGRTMDKLLVLTVLMTYHVYLGEQGSKEL